MNKITILVFLPLVLIGCLTNNHSNIPTSPPNQPNNGTKQSASITPSRIPNSTNSINKTATPLIQELATPTTIKSRMENVTDCMDNGKPYSPRKDFGINGIIVYRGLNGKGLYTAGGTPLVYSQLPVSENQEYELWGFSPDGKTLAFLPIFQENGIPHMVNPIVTLLSPNGITKNITPDMTSITAEIPQDTYLYRWISKPGNWFTNNLINLNIEYAGVNRVFTIHRVFDIRNNVWDVKFVNNLPSQAEYSEVGFSPDLSRALYTKYLDTDMSYQVVLWDLINRKEISNYPGAFPEWSGTRWSSDSSKAAYISNLHGVISLFLVDGDSGVRQEIKLPSMINPAQKANPLSISWSPNSKLLAISTNVYPNNDNTSKITLFIYDTEKRKLIYRCESQNNGSDIYWSPDSKFIIPTDVINPTNELILYNTQSGEVIKIADNVIVGGWSDKFTR